MTQHYDVVIATPGSSFKPEYVTSLVKTTRALNELGISYHLLNKTSSFVPSARELTATDTYSHNWDTIEIGSGTFTYNKIFWIDSDIEWEPRDFIQIYESPLDVISGLYGTTPYGIVAAHVCDENGNPRKIDKTHFYLDIDPVEVGGVGFGFVAMKQGVFENIPRPWFQIRQVQWPELPFTVNMGEDYSWCENARLSGYRIWVDPAVKVKHHKETVFVL
jgi:hypothetical protein